jgi:hypothetical protein
LAAIGAMATALASTLVLSILVLMAGVSNSPPGRTPASTRAVVGAPAAVFLGGLLSGLSRGMSKAMPPATSATAITPAMRERSRRLRPVGSPGHAAAGLANGSCEFSGAWVSASRNEVSSAPGLGARTGDSGK